MNELQAYFKKYPQCPEHEITQHKIPGSHLVMYVVKLPKNQYIHVYINNDNDYTLSLHKLNLDTGEKSRVSCDFRTQSITDVLDTMRPSFEHQGDLDD